MEDKVAQRFQYHCHKIRMAPMWFIFLSFQDASMLEINKYVALVER